MPQDIDVRPFPRPMRAPRLRIRRRVGCIASRLATTLATSFGLAMPAAALHGQQYITDDAAVTEYRACQIQMWHGERSSWVLPVCTPVRNLEVSVGSIAVWDDGAEGHFEYVIQAKTLLRRLETDGWGAGFVVGTGRDPALATTAPQSSSLYAYVPLSLSLARDRVVLHQNTGWLHQRSAGHKRDALTWAGRVEGRVRRHLFLVGEVYGAEGGAAAPAEFQAGVRAFARPGRVQLDLSYGGRLETGRGGQGWTLGLTLMTPPFL